MSGLLPRLFLAGAAILPFAAQAANWHFMLRADKADSLAFFDMSSVVKLGGKIGLASVEVKREDSNFPNSVNAIGHEEAFDCAAKTVQPLTESTFGPGGKLIKLTNVTGPAVPVVSGTLGKHKLDIVCAAGFGPGKRSILYMEIDSDVYVFRDHFVEQERAAAKALAQAQAQGG
jgi:hypothetical protein